MMNFNALTPAVPTNRSARLKSHGDVPRRTILVGIQRNLGQLPLASEVVSCTATIGRAAIILWGVS